MSEYDLLLGVVLRILSQTGAEVYNNIDEISSEIGELIHEKYPSYLILPLGMELVEEDKKIRIIRNLEFNPEFPEE